jgi:hypothetical protein
LIQNSARISKSSQPGNQVQPSWDLLVIRLKVIYGLGGHESILSTDWFIMVNMTKLKHAISETSPAASKTTAYVIGVKSAGTNSTLAKSGLDAKFLASINLESLGVSASLGKTAKVSGPGSSVVLLIGLGTSQELDSLRFASSAEPSTW